MILILQEIENHVLNHFTQPKDLRGTPRNPPAPVPTKSELIHGRADFIEKSDGAQANDRAYSMLLVNRNTCYIFELLHMLSM
jgi:hypothetical protein